MPVRMPESAQLLEIFSALGFVTACPRMIPVLQRAYKAARVSDTTVLLQGETGTGKQVLARAIHRLDEKRGTFPFVTVHCSTVSESLVDSELFGREGRGIVSGFGGENHETDFIADLEIVACCSRLFADR